MEKEDTYKYSLVKIMQRYFCLFVGLFWDFRLNKNYVVYRAENIVKQNNSVEVLDCTITNKLLKNIINNEKKITKIILRNKYVEHI